MTTSTEVRSDLRPLPLNTILKVTGTSFRQDAVRTVVEQDEVRIRHDTVNPHDPTACLVETLNGEHLGFVPKDLAPRLAGLHPGGRWRAKIHDVYRRETWGLRVMLGPLVVEGIREQAGSGSTGLRHRDDGVAEYDGVVVVAAVADAHSTAPDAVHGSADPAESDLTSEAHPPTDTSRAPAPETGPEVRSKSGRLLGTLLEREGTRVVVLTAAGGRTSYPAAVVVVSADGRSS